MADLLEQARSMYELAVVDAAYARERWDSAGKPLEQVAGNGMAGVHPLRKALLDADDRVSRRAESVARLSGASRGRGRPVGATSAVDREPPKVRLRAAS